MSRARQVANLSVEWWRASGERTIERLQSVFDHYAATYALDEDARKEAWELTEHYAHELRP